MIRRERGRCGQARIFLLMATMAAVASCILMYNSLFITPNAIDEASYSSSLKNLRTQQEEQEQDRENCCRGVSHLELWGDAVKWGSDFKFNSSKDCCMACKKMCHSELDSCLCDSWVFCGDRTLCGPKFGECWLKKQKDSLNPELRDSGKHVSWTSGLIFPKQPKGTIAFETEHGLFHVMLYPDCAPLSVNFILEVLALRHCAGCKIFRVEPRGSFWDSDGNHVVNTPYGPPHALIQGSLDVQGLIFHKIPKEECLIIRRGSVAWVGSGPEFFISLANHYEWQKEYTVFGSVIPQDMEVVEKLSQLPTKSDVWTNFNVSVLENPIPIKLHRI